MALSAKVAEGRFFVVDDFHLNEVKTKEALHCIQGIVGCGDGQEEKGKEEGGEGGGENIQPPPPPPSPPSPPLDVLLVDDRDQPLEATAIAHGIRSATSNLPLVHVIPQIGLNVYSLLRRKDLVVTAPALHKLVERLTRPLKPRERIKEEAMEEIKERRRRRKGGEKEEEKGA